MKIPSLFPLFCAAGLLAAEPPPTSPSTPSLTLAAAFARAEEANLTVLIGRETIGTASENMRLARAGLLPTVTIDAQQYRSQSVSYNGTVVTKASPANRLSGNVTTTMPLLDAQQRSTLLAARAGVRAAELDYRSTLEDLLSTLGEAFFAHLRNIERMKVIDANIDRATTLLTLAQNQLNAGVVTQIDVTRAEVQVATVKQSRLQQETVVYQSELALKRLLSLPADDPLRFDNFSVKRDFTALDGASLEAAARTKRPDYLRAEQTVEQYRLTQRAARNERIPTLDAYGVYGVRSLEAFDDRQKTAWSAGVTLSVPVFDSGKRSADGRLAAIRLRTEQLKLDALQKQLAAEVRNAAQDAKSRLAQTGVAEQNKTLAQEQLRLAQVRYQNGVADNREVVEAQNTLAQAEDNLVEAVYQYNLARLELARSRGDVCEILQEKAD